MSPELGVYPLLIPKPETIAAELKPYFVQTNPNVYLASTTHGLSELSKLLPQSARIAYIPTPANLYSQEQKKFIERDHQWLVSQGYAWSEIDIAGKTPEQVWSHLRDVQGVMVPGGNTQYFMEQAQLSGASEIIPELVLRHGVWYIGESAGAIAAGSTITPVADLEPSLASPSFCLPVGLHLIDALPFPHWDNADFMHLQLNGKNYEAIWQEVSATQPTVRMKDM